ncbi:GA2L3 protein, partial [Pitta sordida]|nr:GA2L3 protein [Pitta sordida]
AGTSKKLESPACKSPASTPLQPISKSSSSTGTRTAPVPPETLRKRIRSPDAPKVKFAQPQGSPALHPALSSPKKQLSHLSGTVEMLASKQKRVPNKSKPVSITKTKANSVAPRAAQLPVTNLRAVAKSAHSQQHLEKPPSENVTQISGAESQHPQKAPQTASKLARNLKSASVLKLSASAPSLAVSKASKSSPSLIRTSKNVSSAVSKQPNVSNPPQAGSLSKPPERTPLSVVRLPQTSAKMVGTKKPAQPSTKGQPPTKILQTNKSLTPAAKKPLPKEQMCSKGTPGVSKVPLTKSREEDHYFVMTGSKKPRK